MNIECVYTIKRTHFIMRLTYRILLTTFSFLLAGISAQAQTICLGQDITVCVGSTVQIEDCNPNQNGGNAGDT